MRITNISLTIFLIFTSTINAQFAVVSEPVLDINKPLNIIFDTSKGDQALKNYGGDIYAYIGLITEDSTDNTDWKYTPTDIDGNGDNGWGDIANPAFSNKYLLNNLGNNKYELNSTPTIKSWFGIGSEEIIDIVVVLRNIDGSIVSRTSTGGDILLYQYAVFDCESSPKAGNTCADATRICTLNGYCGNTDTNEYSINSWPQLTSIFRTCPGTIHNNSFLSFIADDTTSKLSVLVTGDKNDIHTDGINYGIQMMVFGGTCGGAVTKYFCDGNIPNNKTTDIEVQGLTKGETYYVILMVVSPV